MTLAALAMVMVTAVVYAAADPAVVRGRAIAQAADSKDAGWVSETLQARMTMKRPNGRSDSRRFTMTLVEGGRGVEEGGLIEILEPARHRGFKVLTLSRPGEEDAVWVRFPAHRRTRRLLGRKRTGRFLGSERTYEDLGSRKAIHYDHRWLREDTLDGIACQVVATRPKDPDTGYSTLHIWRETKSLRLRRVEYFGRDGRTLLKVADFTEFSEISGHSRPGRVVVRDPETGRTTDVVFSDRKIGAGASGAVSLRALER